MREREKLIREIEDIKKGGEKITHIWDNRVQPSEKECDRLIQLINLKRRPRGKRV